MCNASGMYVYIIYAMHLLDSGRRRRLTRLPNACSIVAVWSNGRTRVVCQISRLECQLCSENTLRGEFGFMTANKFCWQQQIYIYIMFKSDRPGNFNYRQFGNGRLNECAQFNVRSFGPRQFSAFDRGVLVGCLELSIWQIEQVAAYRCPCTVRLYSILCRPNIIMSTYINGMVCSIVQ